MDERNDVNLFRKKRAKRKRIGNLVLFTLILLAIILVVANWGRIIAPLKDAALNVGSGGFPVDLPGSSSYRIEALGDNFCLLTDTYFYTYNSDGAMIASIQHGLQNPVIDCSKKRALIYDRNGRGVKLCSRTGEIYTKTMEDSIIFAEMSNSERCAVITNSTRYSNYLYVFNGEGKQIFRWASPEYKILCADFSDDDNSIYVTVTGASGGELKLYAMRFDLDNADSHIWQTYIGNELTLSLSYSGGGVSVITSGGAKMLDKITGEVLYETAFRKNVTDIPESGSRRVVVFSDGGTGRTAVMYTEELDTAASMSIDNPVRIREADGSVYVLTEKSLTKYNASFEQEMTRELDDVYSDVIITGGYAYLLGYNTVVREEL